MSMETIGSIAIIVMLLGLLLIVGVGLSGDGENAPDEEDHPRRSLE